jgi:hypothetical protein
VEGEQTYTKIFLKRGGKMKNAFVKPKLSCLKKLKLMLVALSILALPLPVYADIPLKFVGDLTADALSPQYEAVVNDFFDNDPRSRGDFQCFEGNLLNLHNGKKVGVGVDCLSVAGIADTTSGDTTGGTPDFGLVQNTVNLSAAIDAVTFFFLPRGHLVSDGLTTVRPFFEGIGNGDGTAGEGSVTHLTGSIPGEAPTIVDGSGPFTKLVGVGNVRLSGAVNLSLPSSTFFSCLFVIQFDNLGNQK